MQGRKKKPLKKRKIRRTNWGQIDDIGIEQEMRGGHRRTKAGGGWRVWKKPPPR